MNAVKTALISLAFLLVTAFIGVGYAAPTGSIQTVGSVTYEQKPIFISSVEWVGGNVSGLDDPYYIGDTMRSTVKLAANSNSYAVAKVTVKNCTNDIYGYNRTYAVSGTDTYDNFNITYSLYTDSDCKNKMLRRTEVHPLTTAEGENGLIFYVKFNYIDKYSPKQAEELNSFLCYEFLTPVSSIDEEKVDVETINGVVDKMEQILNDDTDYSVLLKAIQDPDWDTSRGDDYIGTVIGSNSDDTEFLETLFSGNLNMIIDGEKVDVTIMVKYGDVTGDGVDDFTIYATTETLDRSGKRVPVYAQVFTSSNGASGLVWDKRGDTYKGYANVNAYDWPHIGSGSFNTDSWTTNSSSSWRGDSIEDLV
jgi:hypothetical protein